MGFTIMMPPYQRAFTEDDVASLDVGRRQLCSEWPSTLKKPAAPGQDWPLLLPFANSYRNAFEVMCETVAFPHVALSGKLCLFLKDIDFDSGPPQEVHDWIATVGKYVAMKDYLALSFALDYDRVGGDPNKAQTSIGALRSGRSPTAIQRLPPLTQLPRKSWPGRWWLF